MVQVIERNDLFGRIGKNLGEGLGTGLEQSVSANRSANIIEKAATPQDGKPFNYLQLVTQLMRDPKNTPEKMNMLLPLIRNQMIANQGQTPQASTQTSPASTQTPETSTQTQPALSSPPVEIGSEEYKPFESSKYIPTREQIRAQGEQLSRYQPARFPTVELGIEEAQKQADSNEARYNKANEQYDNKLLNRLQSTSVADSWSQVPGEISERIVDDMNRAVLEDNVNPSVAANKAVDKAVNFAKIQKKLKSLGGPPIFGAPSKQIESDYKQSRKAYEDLGALEQFKDTLIGMGHSQFFASSVAYPISDSVDKTISDLTNIELASEYDPKKALANLSREKHIKKYESSLDKIVSDITNKDSLHSIALSISDRGYDPILFYDAIRDASERNELNLTERQTRELIENQPVKFSLFDILSLNLTAPDRTTKVPTWEKIRRTYFGKK